MEFLQQSCSFTSFWSNHPRKILRISEKRINLYYESGEISKNIYIINTGRKEEKKKNKASISIFFYKYFKVYIERRRLEY